jgi:hypothetical protein
MQFTGYIVRETEAAVAFVLSQDAGSIAKPLWIPRSKIDECEELDELSKAIQLEGETLSRCGIPVIIDVQNSFLRKIGIA